MNIYFFEYYDPEVDAEDELMVAYFLSDTEENAYEQFNNHVSGVDPSDMGCYTFEEIEEYNVTDNIINFAFGVDDDNLLLAILKNHPHKTFGVVTHILYSQLMPKSLTYMLSFEPRTDMVEKSLQIMVGDTNIGYADILIQHGIRDDSGLALARACLHGKKDMFDLIYPVSNPLKALQIEKLRHRDWIEERMSVEQQEVLNTAVSHLNTPSLMRTKKI